MCARAELFHAYISTYLHVSFTPILFSFFQHTNGDIQGPVPRSAFSLYNVLSCGVHSRSEHKSTHLFLFTWGKTALYPMHGWDEHCLFRLLLKAIEICFHLSVNTNGAAGGNLAYKSSSTVGTHAWKRDGMSRACAL